MHFTGQIQDRRRLPGKIRPGLQTARSRQHQQQRLQALCSAPFPRVRSQCGSTTLSHLPERWLSHGITSLSEKTRRKDRCVSETNLIVHIRPSVIEHAHLTIFIIGNGFLHLFEAVHHKGAIAHHFFFDGQTAKHQQCCIFHCGKCQLIAVEHEID